MVAVEQVQGEVQDEEGEGAGYPGRLPPVQARPGGSGSSKILLQISSVWMNGYIRGGGLFSFCFGGLSQLGMSNFPVHSNIIISAIRQTH